MSKTIEILPETKGSLLCLKLSGMVTPDDFRDYFDAGLVRLMDRHGHYSLYLHYAPDFEGWMPEAADLSFKSISTVGPNLRRAAYVNPPEGRILMMKLLEPIMAKAQVRYFNEAEKDLALAWVKETAE